MNKSSPSERERYLEAVAMPPDLRRLAATSEDAFDAAVSALVMAAGVEDLRASPRSPPTRWQDLAATPPGAPEPAGHPSLSAHGELATEAAGSSRGPRGLG